MLIAVVKYQEQGMRSELTDEFSKQSRKVCASVARDVWMMLRTQHETVLNKVTADLNVARDALQTRGGISFAEENVTWDAINQYTKTSQQLSLPKMMVGPKWLGQNTSMSDESPIVDHVQNMVGGTCTIFQRMNEAGDMLRVCTNVKKLDGTRAIGTFIPATNPDGAPNPVISTVLKGNTFNGRAYVVNDWYLTAYEPILDEQKEVVGVLYVGVQQEAVKELRQGIMDLVVGKTGYVYILGGSGQQRGDYVISKDGKRDGENIWEAKDAAGHPFIQSIINKALITKDGECEFEYYDWQNKGEAKPRGKIAAATYFAPWDWVIGASTYESDFQDGLITVERTLARLTIWSVIGAFIVCVVLGTLAAILGKRISGGIRQTADTLKDLAQGDGDLTVRFELKDIEHEDEVGRMHRHFNDFVDKIRSVIVDISNNAQTLVSSATQLSQTATQLASGSEETTAQSTSVAAAAEQMSTNMQGMASGTEEMSANVKTVAAAVEEMTASISEVAKNAEHAAQIAGEASNLAQTSNQNIGQLGEAADAIGKVIETIQDIAEQTNLLALNATIEAARAGDAGKGFAVVANEVKDLAKQTAEATEDIRHRIEGIQSSTGLAVTSIGNISEVIAKVNEVSRTIASAVEEQSITTREIAQNVAQTATAAETVSTGVQQSASAAQEITHNIARVDDAARQGAEGAGKTQTASEQLSGLGQQLQHLVDQFKV